MICRKFWRTVPKVQSSVFVSKMWAMEQVLGDKYDFFKKRKRKETEKKGQTLYFPKNSSLLNIQSLKNSFPLKKREREKDVLERLDSPDKQ